MMPKTKSTPAALAEVMLQYMTVAEAAAELAVSTTTVTRMLQERTLSETRLFDRVLLKRSEVALLAKERSAVTPAR